MLGQVFQSTAQAVSFLVFSGLYFPCLSTFGVLRQVVGRKRSWAVAIWSMLVAYLGALLTYYAFFMPFALVGGSLLLLLLWFLKPRLAVYRRVLEHEQVLTPENLQFIYTAQQDQ